MSAYDLGVALTEEPSDEVKMRSISIYKKVRGMSSFLFAVPIPKTFQIRLQSNYRDFMNLSAGAALKNVMNMLGMSVQFKWSTTKLWNSSSPMEFQLPVELVAISDAYEEVYKKITTIMDLASPSLATNQFASSLQMLVPPGPNLFEAMLDNLETIVNAVISHQSSSIDDNEKLDKFKKEEKLEKLSDVKTAIGKVFDTIGAAGAKVQGFFSGPGSEVGKVIKIKIGNFLEFDNLVLKNANITMGDSAASTMPVNFNGFPLKAFLQLDLAATEIFTDNAQADGSAIDKFCVEALKTMTAPQRELVYAGRDAAKEEEKVLKSERVKSIFSKLSIGL